MFLILAAYGLRRDQQAERDRLRAAGARTGQLVAFSLAEAAWLAGVAVVAGAALGAGARAGGLPGGAARRRGAVAQPADGARGGGAGRRLVRRRRPDRHRAAGARRPPGRRARSRRGGGARPGADRRGRQRRHAGDPRRAAGMPGRRRRRLPRRRCAPARRRAADPRRAAGHPPGARRPGPLPGGAGTGGGVRRGQHGAGRIRPRLPRHAPARGRRRSRPAGRTRCADRAIGELHPAARHGDAEPLASARRNPVPRAGGAANRRGAAAEREHDHVAGPRRPRLRADCDPGLARRRRLGSVGHARTASGAARAGPGPGPAAAGRRAPPDGARAGARRRGAAERRPARPRRRRHPGCAGGGEPTAAPRTRARTATRRPLRARGLRGRRAHRGRGPQRSPERREPGGRHAVDDDGAAGPGPRGWTLPDRRLARLARCRRLHAGRDRGRRSHTRLRRQRTTGRPAGAPAQRRAPGAGADRPCDGRRSGARRRAPRDRRRRAGHGARGRDAAALSDDRGRWAGVRDRRRGDARRRARCVAARTGPERRAVDLDGPPGPTARRPAPAAAGPAERQFPHRRSGLAQR